MMTKENQTILRLQPSDISRIIKVNDQLHPEWQGSNVYGLIRMILPDGSSHLVGTVGKSGFIYDFTDNRIVYDFADIGGNPVAGGDSYHTVARWRGKYYFGGWIIAPSPVGETLNTAHKHSYIVETEDLENWRVIMTDQSTSSTSWQAEVSDLIPTEDYLYILRGDIGKGGLGSGAWIYDGTSIRNLTGDHAIKGTIHNDKLHYGIRRSPEIRSIDLLNGAVSSQNYDGGPTRVGGTSTLKVFGSISTLVERLFVGADNGFFLDNMFVPLLISPVENEGRIVGWRNQLLHVNGGLLVAAQIQDSGPDEAPGSASVNSLLLHISAAGQIRCVATGRFFAAAEVYNDRIYYGTSPHSHRNRHYNYQYSDMMLSTLSLDDLKTVPYLDRIRYETYDPESYGVHGWFGGYPTFAQEKIVLDFTPSEAGTLTIGEWGMETDLRERTTMTFDAGENRVIDLTPYCAGNLIGFRYSTPATLDAVFYAR